MNKTLQFAGILFFLYLNTSLAQTIYNPVVNSKTHPTLNIEKIVRTDTNTVFYMNIKNELEKNGAFCVDKNVFVSIPGKRIKFEMTHSDGIENCPDVHKFSQVGETVGFRLYFPAINDSIKELDLVENCNDNCFTIRGIILDPIINAEIHSFDTGVLYYRKGELKPALKYFKNIVDTSKNIKSKYYAYSLYILPVIYYKINDTKSAKKAFDRLVNSEIIDKDYFIKKIKEIEFFNEK